MPWSPEEASKHKKGLGKKGSKQWSSIANSVLQRTGDEGQAIRIASGALKRRLRK